MASCECHRRGRPLLRDSVWVGGITGEIPQMALRHLTLGEIYCALRAFICAIFFSRRFFCASGKASVSKILSSQRKLEA